MSFFIEGYPTRVCAGAWPRVDRVRVAEALTLPISLQDAKASLRLTTSYEDASIVQWIRIGTRRVERDTGLCLLPQTWDLFCDRFPSRGVLDLQPYAAPVQSVVSLTTTDADGVSTTLDPSTYALVGNRIGLHGGAAWPANLRSFAPIAIRVVAGFASEVDIPDDLLHLVRVVVGWQYLQVEPPAQKAAYDDIVTGYRTLLVC